MQRKAPAAAGLRVERVALAVWAIALVATSVALVMKHLSFETNAFDLGIKAEVARNAFFKGSFYSDITGMDTLGDHFSPVLLLLGPLFLIWNNAAVLLLFQNVCVFLSMLLAFELARRILGDTRRSLALAAFYAVNVYLHRVNRFDYHPESIAIPLILLLMVALEGGRSRRTLASVALLSCALLAIKEDLPLILGTYGLWVLLFRRDRRAEGALMAGIGLVGFAVIVRVLMPHHSGGDYTHIGRYSALGDSAGDVIICLLTHPHRVALALVSPPSKLLCAAELLSSFALLPLLAPAMLLPGLTPILCHLLSGFTPQYSFQCHYSASALPFLYYATVHGARRLEGILARLRVRSAAAASACVLILLGAWAGQAAYFVGRYAKNIVRFSPARYVMFQRDVVPSVPAWGHVIASSEMVPHFVPERRCSLLKPCPGGIAALGRRTDYLVFDKTRASWPFTPDEYYRELGRARRAFQVHREVGPYVVFDTHRPVTTRTGP